MSTTSMPQFIPPDPEPRSITELVLRTLATHIFALTAYGHLGSLLNLPTHLHVLSVLLFLLCPGLVVGQLVYGYFSALYYIVTHHRGVSSSTSTSTSTSRPDSAFVLQATLGVHALPHSRALLDHGTDAFSPISLFSARHTGVQRATYATSWKWAGRVLVSALLLVQATGTVVLFFRRLVDHSDARDFTKLDIINGVAAFGGMITGSMTLLLLLMRMEWLATNSPPRRADDGSDALGSELLKNKGLTALATQLWIGFVCTGWMRGDVFWWIWQAPLYGNWLEIVAIVFFVYVFRRDIVKRMGVSTIWPPLVLLCAIMIIVWIGFVTILLEAGFDLAEQKDAGWKDPWSDRLLVI